MKSPKLTPAQRKLIDAYAAARRDFAAWRPAVNPYGARVAELLKQVTELTDKEPADQELVLAGYRFTLPVGMKRLKRTVVNVPALFKKLGAAWVAKHCAPNLGDLDKALEPAERAKFIEEKRDLSRIVGEPVEATALSIAA